MCIRDRWDVGRRVNLERALRAGDRLGGHFVQGHVDGVARVTAVAVDGDAQIADLALPAGLAELMVQHGSCLLYTSDAADERSSVDLGGRRIIKKKKKI